MTQLHIRNLTTQDAAQFRELRLRALQEYPEAFGSSFEEEQTVTLEQTINVFSARQAPQNFVAGAFQEDGTLVGTIGFFQQSKRKLQHKGMIWGMYVIPGLHGAGAGSKLLLHVIEQARQIPGLTQIQLAVVTSNEPAKRLYQKHGFVAYGLEKDALITGGQSYDEDLMALYL